MAANAQSSPKVTRSLATGLVSGFASTLALQPFDFVKTQLQQNDASVGIRSVLKSNGPLSLWRGTTPTLWRNVPGIAFYFTSLSRLRPALANVPILRTNGRLSSIGDALAGATARTAVGFALNPFSVLKARMESRLYSYDSVWTGLRSLAREGPKGMLRGAGASALRDAPFAGIYMAAYQSFKRIGSRMTDAGAVVNSVAAASAAGVAGIVTHPFDVLKTRIQVREEVRYRTIRGTAAYIWKTTGVRGFYDGLSLRFGRKVASSTIAWVVYEAIIERWH
ncbi:mitochondrial carrier [Auriculariales sp. MPI-PUGE-AT-0066]|nr:mitochondrial carrier [Auriculariales sp. MPI-PUGE-AT-0066]